jgi:hypothetical protein
VCLRTPQTSYKHAIPLLLYTPVSSARLFRYSKLTRCTCPRHPKKLYSPDTLPQLVVNEVGHTELPPPPLPSPPSHPQAPLCYIAVVCMCGSHVRHPRGCQTQPRGAPPRAPQPRPRRRARASPQLYPPPPPAPPNHASSCRVSLPPVGPRGAGARTRGARVVCTCLHPPFTPNTFRCL